MSSSATIPAARTDPKYKGKSIDYLSPVEKDGVLAEIDPTTYRGERDAAAAALNRAKADLLQLKAKLDQAERAWKRAQDPRKAKAIGDSDYDEAETNYKMAGAGVAAGEATVKQAELVLEHAQTNLDRTIIRSPIKGLIIDRRVNLGQNVGPNSGHPSLFLIAKDVEKVQVRAAVNEADIGRIKNGMDVRFTVNAFPKELFKGKVAQVRLNAETLQNVVAYPVVVDCEDPDHKLMPYLTANLQFVIETRHNVLRVPNAALRWQPRPAGLDTRDADAAQAATYPDGRSRLWVKGQRPTVRAIAVQLGLSDGALTEVSGPDVREGMEVVVGGAVGGPQPDNAPAPFAPRPFKRASASPSTQPTQSPDQGKSAESPAKAAVAPAINPAAELKALQGEWKVVRFEKGEAASSSWPLMDPPFQTDSMNPETIDRLQITEGGLALSDHKQGQRFVARYRVNPTTTPGTIDLVNSVGFGAERKERIAAVGIYEVKGDRLKVCLAQYHTSLEAEQRPKGFAIGPGSADVLFTLERYRLPQTAAEDLQAIQGEWKTVAQVEDGKAASEVGMAALAAGKDGVFSLSFSHEECTINFERKGQLCESTAAFDLDPAQQAKAITIFSIPPPWFFDRTGSRLAQAKQGLCGIYKLGGDKLTIAYRPDGPRPEKFESLPGSGVTLLVLERPKSVADPKPDELNNGDSQTPPSPATTPPATDGTPKK